MYSIYARHPRGTPFHVLGKDLIGRRQRGLEAEIEEALVFDRNRVKVLQVSHTHTRVHQGLVERDTGMSGWAATNVVIDEKRGAGWRWKRIRGGRGSRIGGGGASGSVGSGGRVRGQVVSEGGDEKLERGASCSA